MVLTERTSSMPLVISSQRSLQPTAPEILTRLQSLEVDKGTTVTLSVIVAGNPAPSITWSLDDEILHEKNQRFIFERDDTENKHSLVITHITRSQEGVYRCVARNCEGSCATMGFITVKEVIRRRRRNVSKRPKIATINEWKSQEEKEVDSEQDTFLHRNRHCWDWWNMDALSDNDDVFEKSEINNEIAKHMLPNPAANKHKTLKAKPGQPKPNPLSKSSGAESNRRSGAESNRRGAAENNRRSVIENNRRSTSQKTRDRKQPPTRTQEEPTPHTPMMPIRRDFARARSAEPESNLSRQKSKSLPDLGLSCDTAANKYRKLKAFWEQITRKK